MAERHPRDLDVVREKLLKECRRPGFAKTARYVKPIGRGVEGVSIRFAESAIRIMGNISVDTMTVYDDRERRIVRVTVVDCENNIPYSTEVNLEKTIERRSIQKSDEVIRTRQNRQGQTLYVIAATEDDLLNKQNAQVSKAIRTNGLRLVPADIIEECMEEVLRTQANEDAADPDAARRKLFDAFGKLGVSVSELKFYLGHEGTPSPAEMTKLRGIYSALRDGETTWRDVLEQLPAEGSNVAELDKLKTATQSVKEQLQSKSQAKRLNAIEGKPLDAPRVEPLHPAEIWPAKEKPDGDKS